jgi:NRPS condensation-like uncharacterized protein
MTHEEIERNLINTFVKVNKNGDGKEIKEDADLTRFLELEVAIPFKENELMYKLFAVEDFNEKESVLLFKCHHALADGMSLMGLITCLQD